MLAKIRKGTDSLFVKIILIIIALSFVAVGGSSFVGNSNNKVIVSFDQAPSISLEAFQIAKAKEIEYLQRQNGITLTEENIIELGINNSVLNKLINQSMAGYLAQYYDFDISEDFIINNVKKTTAFQNSNGEFDANIFKTVLRNAQMREDEYISSLKKQLMITNLLEIFTSSFAPPKLMIDNMIDYMSETRVVDILTINLSHRPSHYKSEEITTEQLKYFYDKNQELFTISENRNFNYIKADKGFLLKKIQPSEAELKQFFEENKEDFVEKNYLKAKKQVLTAFNKEQLELLSNELAKDFEAEIAGGLSLIEIAQKYALKIHSEKDISLTKMYSSAKKDYVEIADSVFEMTEGEISYPIETSNNQILLVELASITPSRQQSFEESKSQITYIIKKRMLSLFNMDQFQKLKDEYTPQKINKAALKAKGITSIINKSFTRSESLLEDKFSIELLQSIFAANKEMSTKIYVDASKNKAYVAYVKTIKKDKTKSKLIRKNSTDHFSNIIREGVFQELMTLLKEKNNMKLQVIKQEELLKN